MRTVQADSCLNSEQIDTLFISVGGLGGGCFGPKFTRDCHDFFFTPPAAPLNKRVIFTLSAPIRTPLKIYISACRTNPQGQNAP